MKRLKIERFIFLICLIICLIAIIISGIEVKAMQADMQELEHKNLRQAAQLHDKEEQIKILEIILEYQEEPEPKETYAGEFEITFYCPCEKCCGKVDGITATGTLAKEGQTVAADWDIILPGTRIYIDGIGYRTVEDKGGAIKGKHLDVYMNSHAAALDAGRCMADVVILEVLDDD